MAGLEVYSWKVTGFYERAMDTETQNAALIIYRFLENQSQTHFGAHP